MRLYGKMSKRLMSYLRSETLSVEVFSIDEAFVEITGIAESKGMYIEEYVADLQKRIKQDIGIPVSIGVSNTRLRAKIFSKVHKPYGYFVAFDTTDVDEKFQQLSLREIPFIGKSYESRLFSHIQTVYDFKKQSFWYLKRVIGKNATQIWLELHGVHAMTFGRKGKQKSISKTRSFNHHITTDPGKIWKRLLVNVERLFEELTLKEYEIRNITLLLKTKEFTYTRKTAHFSDYSNDRTLVCTELQKLFRELYIPGVLYRSTGVTSTDIRPYTPKQMNLFAEKNVIFEKRKKLEECVLRMNQRYGKGKIHIGI